MNRQEILTELERVHTESFGWALRCCFEEAEAAEEVLQSVYLKILKGKARYNNQSAFKTWLFSVIRYTVAPNDSDEGRAKNRRVEFVLL